MVQVVEIDEHKPDTKPEDLVAIVETARKMYKLHVEIEAAEKELADKKKEFNDLQLVKLPEQMSSCGLSSFKLDNGYIIDVKEFIRASVPTESAISEADDEEKAVLQDRRKKALAWLRKHKADSLIKNKLTAEFGKGMDKAAKQFFALIKKAKVPVKCEESINFQTLNSYIKEQLGKGVDVPSEPFGLFIGKKAEIKKAKQ